MKQAMKSEWESFADYVSSLIPNNPSARQIWKIIGEWTTSHELIEEFRLLQAIYGNTTQDAVSEYLLTGKFPWEKIDEVSAELLSIRLREAAYFAHECHLSFYRATQIIPFPEDSREEILQWFVEGWWHEHGLRRVCQRQVALKSRREV